MSLSVFPGRIPSCFGLLVPIIFLLGIAFADTPARADATVSYAAATSATQTIFTDEGEGDAQVDFAILGGSGSVRLITGVPQTLIIGSSHLDESSDNEEEVSGRLTVSRQFTISGVTNTLAQTDDLYGGGDYDGSGGDATAHVYVGTPVTFDLGTAGQVDVTPQDYQYDLNANPTAPGFQYQLFLRAPAAPPASITASPSTVTYPASATGTVTLAQPAPAGGENVVLTASDSTVSVPALVPVPAGAMTVTFPITTSRVDVNTAVTLTATAEQQSVSTVFTVLTRPETTFTYSLAGLPTQAYVGSDAEIDFSITGGSGSVALAQGIPYTVDVGSYNLSGYVEYEGYLDVTGVTVSRNLTLGGIAKRWPQNIDEIRLYTDDFDDVYYFVDIAPPMQLVYDFGSQGVVVVTAAGLDEDFPPLNTPIPVTFTLLPAYPAVASVTVSPGSVYEGAVSYGRIDLTAPAPVGGETVTLSSADTGAASVPASVTVPEGQTSASFPIATFTVHSDTPVRIAAVRDGTGAAASLTVLSYYALGGNIISAKGPVKGVQVRATAYGSFILTTTARPNAEIPDDDLTGLKSTVSPVGTGTITNLVVGLNITHQNIGDLLITLTSPDGTRVVLQDPGGASLRNITTSYPVLTVPAQSLSAFSGKPVAGVWTLTVADTITGKVGTLNSWSITTTYTGSVTSKAFTAADGAYSLPRLKEGSYTVFPTLTGHVFSPPYQMVTIGPSESPPSPQHVDFVTAQP